MKLYVLLKFHSWKTLEVVVNGVVLPIPAVYPSEGFLPVFKTIHEAVEHGGDPADIMEIEV